LLLIAEYVLVPESWSFIRTLYSQSYLPSPVPFRKNIGESHSRSCLSVTLFNDWAHKLKQQQQQGRVEQHNETKSETGVRIKKKKKKGFQVLIPDPGSICPTVKSVRFGSGVALHEKKRHQTERRVSGASNVGAWEIEAIVDPPSSLIRSGQSFFYNQYRRNL